MSHLNWVWIFFVGCCVVVAEGACDGGGFVVFPDNKFVATFCKFLGNWDISEGFETGLGGNGFIPCNMLVMFGVGKECCTGG